MKWLPFFKENPTLALAIISGYIYLCTYQYESSYLSEFNISSDYLSFDINTILKDSAHVIALAIGVLSINELLKMSLKRLMNRSDAHKWFINLVIKLTVSGCLFFVAWPIPNRYVIYLIGSIVGLYILLFISIAVKMLIEKIRKKPYVPAIKAEDKSPSSFFELVYPIFFVFFLCEILGNGEAYKQTKFGVLNDSTNYVVIRKYGDYLICKDLKKNHIVGSKTIIYKLSDSKPLSITEKTLGQISASNEVLK